MEGNPAGFEWRGSRIGCRTKETPAKIVLDWSCPLFPSLLCLALSLLLFFPSFFIAKAIWLKGAGPALSLWYFPIMNLILFGIGIYLLTLRRKVVLQGEQGSVSFTKQSLTGSKTLQLGFEEILRAEVASDLVRISLMPAGAGSRDGYPVPALRLVLVNGQTVLVERGKRARVLELGEKISRMIGCPLSIKE